MNSRRFIVFLYVVLLTLIGVGAGAFLIDAQAEFDKLKQDQAASSAKLAAARTRLQEQQTILERLRSDPRFVEDVIRTQLGYGRPGPGEVIFRFDSGP
ncbi:FtsB/FtsL family cell division protein [Horticoccus sp. 23ND18S-11]|uniref:septum formation initiator family protein n=1 Tax=Horticoccus sp. 23ND18S-11 TaxID=3391832 RepID=UPI0039C908C6